jgi:hypothetical protein
MSSILDCIGKEIKISKNSITIKGENGKTCGVVRNVISLHDIQPNKQIEYYKMLKEANLNTKISNKNCFIKDNELYIFRNIKSKLFHDKYGYFSDNEKEKEKMNDTIYKIALEKGFKVIECIF